MNQPKQAEALRVTDSSATEEVPERTHEIIVNGEVKEIVFKYGEPTILPFEQGVKFMKDGFTVEEADGSELELPAVATDNVVAQLAPDECVAKYSELSFSSLKLRAAQKPDGEIFLEAEEESRQDIIAFLIGDAPQTATETENLLEEGDEEKSEFEKAAELVVAHFGDGRENVAIREVEEGVDGAPIFAVVHVATSEGADDAVLVQGTINELHEAAVNGVSADRFNSDQAAALEGNPEVEGGDAGTEGTAENDNPETSSPEGENAEDGQETGAQSGTVDPQPSSPDGENGEEKNPEATEDAPDGSTPQPEEAQESGGESDETPSDDENPKHGDANPDEQKFSLEEVENSTDAALRKAVEYGIDINDVPGTGEDGNVLVGDVEAHIEANNLQPVEQSAAE